MWTLAAPLPLRVGEDTIALVALYPLLLIASELYLSQPLRSNSDAALCFLALILWLCFVVLLLAALLLGVLHREGAVFTGDVRVGGCGVQRGEGSHSRDCGHGEEPCGERCTGATPIGCAAAPWDFALRQPG